MPVLVLPLVLVEADEIEGRRIPVHFDCRGVQLPGVGCRSVESQSIRRHAWPCAW